MTAAHPSLARTGRPPPSLHKAGDRVYSLVGLDIGGLRGYLEALGFTHHDRRPGDLFLHRWRSADGRSTVTLFPSLRLVVLGPPLAVLDELVECAEVPR